MSDSLQSAQEKGHKTGNFPLPGLVVEQSMANKNRARAIVSIALKWAELCVGLLVITVAIICGIDIARHAVLEVLSYKAFGAGDFSVRSIILDAMNVLILFEIAQMFLSMEGDHKVHIKSLVDTAILFSMREVILKMYGDLPGIKTAVVVAGIFLLFRLVLQFSKKIEQSIGYKETK